MTTMSLHASTARRTARTAVAVWTMCIAAFVAVLSASHPVVAHSDFSGSEPADGAEVAEAVDVMELTFALAVADPGGGVAAVATDGTTVVASLSTNDDRVWQATFDPPLGLGSHEVRYAMRAEDGHMVSGAVTVTVTAVASETGSSSDGVSDGGVVDNGVVDNTGDSAPTGDDSGGLTDEPTGSGMVSDSAGTNSGDDVAGEAAESVTENDVDSGDTAQEPTATPQEAGPAAVAGFAVAGWVDPVDHAARLIGDLMSLLVVGALWFAMLVWRRPGYLPAPRLIGGLAMVLAVASALEVLALSERLGVSVGDTLTDPLARSPLVAGLAAVALVLTAFAVNADQVSAAPSVVRAVIAVPMAAIVLAPAFDGHAVTLGPRWVHAASDVVHTVATSVWLGAVVGLIAVGVHDRGALAVIAARVARSLVGTVAAVVASGLMMTVMIIDAPSDLIDTPWGRRLLVKLVAVALAAGLGGYHHRVVVPALRVSGDSAMFRRTLALEAVLLMSVVAVTSWLVVSMP